MFVDLRKADRSEQEEDLNMNVSAHRAFALLKELAYERVSATPAEMTTDRTTKSSLTLRTAMFLSANLNMLTPPPFRLPLLREG